MGALPRTGFAIALGSMLGLGAAFAAPAVAAADAEQLDQRVRRLENILDSGQLARLIRRLDTLNEEIRELRGEVEVQAHRLGELRERQRSLYGDLDRRLRELEVAGQERRDGDDDEDAERPAEDAGESDGGGDADDGGAGSGSAGSTSSGAEAREAYEAAFGLLKDGRYEQATEAFSRFVDEYPQGAYADNAQYWLGEARYVTRDFEAALTAFREIVERYPDSAKVPDARLKIGYTLHELERYADAETALQEVAAEHSGSTVARLAEERLLRLERDREGAE